MQMVKNLPVMQETWVDPWVGKIPWRRAWQPTLVFLPGESHGQRSLAGYSPWSRKESDMTEWLSHRVWKGKGGMKVKVSTQLCPILCNHMDYTVHGILQARILEWVRSDQIRSVFQSCPTLCDLMNPSTPGLPVHHQLPEFTQTHVHRVSDAIQPFHPLLSPSPLAPNPSQHHSLFQWINYSHEVAKVLEFQL